MNRLPAVSRLVGFALLALFFNVTAFAAGYVVRAASPAAAPLPLPAFGSDPYPLLTEIRGLLAQRFIGTLPDAQKLEYGMAHGLVGALGDPYTVFVEPQPHEIETNSLAGEYGGVGVEMSQTVGGDFVLNPYPDSPAAAQGVLPADVLLKVDQTPIVRTMTVDAVAALVRGPVESTVTLRVRHPQGAEADIAIIRQTYTIPSVTWRLLTEDPAIGLIAISRFSGKTAAETLQAADALQAQGAQKLVLDLRGNGGGILEAAVDTAALFLDGGVVMYETQRQAAEKTYLAPANTGPLATIPLVVLVNHNTASAAEILAGALLDRSRALLVGQTTYGKGSVQLVFDLSDGSSLHVTSFLWYTPARRALDKTGLAPTLAVEPDSELARAVQYLQTGR
jgi:carboxyl-terminal processing protease